MRVCVCMCMSLDIATQQLLAPRTQAYRHIEWCLLRQTPSLQNMKPYSRTGTLGGQVILSNI